MNLPQSSWKHSDMQLLGKGFLKELFFKCPEKYSFFSSLSEFIKLSNYFSQIINND